MDKDNELLFMESDKVLCSSCRQLQSRQMKHAVHRDCMIAIIAAQGAVKLVIKKVQEELSDTPSWIK